MNITQAIKLVEALGDIIASLKYESKPALAFIQKMEARGFSITYDAAKDETLPRVVEPAPGTMTELTTRGRVQP
jgi:hypothetical protein